MAVHSIQTIEHGIKKTTQKNLATGNLMTTDHKLRFASAVMKFKHSTESQRARKRGSLVIRIARSVQPPYTCPDGSEKVVGTPEAFHAA